jgi:hypothetical protein
MRTLKISQLIRSLQRVLKVHGDLPVLVESNCSDCPVVRGNDAKRLIKAMKHTKPVSKAEYDRAHRLYDKINANTKAAERQKV